LSLLKHGIKSTVYESRPASYEIGGSITLSSNANRMLDYLGVYQQFLSAGYICGESTIFNLKGEKTGSFEVSNVEKYGYPAVIAFRNTLRTILLEECVKQGLSVRYNMRFCAASEDPSTSSTTVHFDNGEIINVDLLVGADGMWSRVREAIAPGIKPEFTGQIAIRGLMDLKNSPDIIGKSDIGMNTKIIVGPAGRFVTSPLDSECNQVTFHTNLTTHARSKEEWRAFSADLPGMKAMMQHFSEAPWPEYVRKLVTETPAEGFDCWP
jgi:2-polyprenyl-6-methoxyphenol hydroxylase-like FAD-dependent oxidoreductase